MTFTLAPGRRESALATLAIGKIAACTMLFPRVMLAALLNLDAARPPIYLIAPFAIGLGSLVPGGGGATDRRSPMTANPPRSCRRCRWPLFQIALFAVGGVGRASKSSRAGAVLGLTDVDALTLAMTRRRIGRCAGADAAAMRLASATCPMKTVLAVALGTPAFRRVTGAVLAAMAVAIFLARRSVMTLLYGAARARTGRAASRSA